MDRKAYGSFGKYKLVNGAAAFTAAAPFFTKANSICHSEGTARRIFLRLRQMAQGLRFFADAQNDGAQEMTGRVFTSI